MQRDAAWDDKHHLGSATFLVLQGQLLKEGLPRVLTSPGHSATPGLMSSNVIQFSFKCFPENAFESNIFSNLSGLFWLL